MKATWAHTVPDPLAVPLASPSHPLAFAHLQPPQSAQRSSMSAWPPWLIGGNECVRDDSIGPHGSATCSPLPSPRKHDEPGSPSVLSPRLAGDNDAEGSAGKTEQFPNILNPDGSVAWGGGQ